MAKAHFISLIIIDSGNNYRELPENVCELPQKLL